MNYGLQQIWIIFGLCIAADLDHNLDIGLWIAADLYHDFDIGLWSASGLDQFRVIII